MPDFRKLLSRFCGPDAAQLLADLWRYGLCSVLALAVDWGLMLALIQLGMNYLVAATTSFLVGMGVAYIGSVLFVYRDRRSYSAVTEALGFVLIGVAGLIVNAALLFVFVKFAGLSAGLAKAPTAVGVFLFNFAARRALLFTGNATGFLSSTAPVALDIE
ncbi:MAG TPA: GtrA family protein [Methylovirgula sp.]|nr:GtrA family protein [Methylovirgula sp.]